MNRKNALVLASLALLMVSVGLAACTDTGGELARTANVGRLTVRTESGETNPAVTIDNQGSGVAILLQDHGVFLGSLDNGGEWTLDGGIAPPTGQACSPRLVSVCDQPAIAGGDGTDRSSVITEVSVGEIFVPCNMTVTGVALLNGAAVAGNLKVGLADSTGVVVATSASTAQVGIDTIQRYAFTATYAAIGPATYYVLTIGDTAGGTQQFNTVTFGNCGASLDAGNVYATGFTAVTPPTTFTTALAPIASLY